MSRQAAIRKIAEGLYELADALFAEDAVSEAVAPVSAAPTADDDLFPPSEPVYEALPIPADAPGLGRCPTHGTAWSVKNAGVSKAGKAYNSFWKCDGKDADGTYCNKKPVKAWADAHPLA